DELFAPPTLAASLATATPAIHEDIRLCNPGRTLKTAIAATIAAMSTTEQQCHAEWISLAKKHTFFPATPSDHLAGVLPPEDITLLKSCLPALPSPGSSFDEMVSHYERLL